MDSFDLKGKTVLVIDDEPANLSVMVDYLSVQGIEIMLAKSGQDGIQRAKLGRPDLILLDVRMPGMDGYDVCAELKRSPATQDIPVIFLSALGEVVDKLKGFAAGGVDYITKPIDEAELLARVSTHMKLAELQLELQDRTRRLEGAIDTSNVVNVAVGVLMERHKLDRREAFDSIRNEARSKRIKVQVVAEELLNSFEQLNLNSKGNGIGKSGG